MSTYREIFEKRGKISKEIDILNSMRYEEKTDQKEINQKIDKLKERYNYYNNLLKAMK